MPARNRYYQIHDRQDAEWAAITSTADTCFPTYQEARDTMQRLDLQDLDDPVVVRVDFIRTGDTLVVGSRVIESPEQDLESVTLLALRSGVERITNE